MQLLSLKRVSIMNLLRQEKGSPLLIGVGRNEYYVASDASPIIEYTNEVIYLKDGEMARLNCDENIEIKTIQNKSITPYIHELKVSLDNIEKGVFLILC